MQISLQKPRKGRKAHRDPPFREGLEGGEYRRDTVSAGGAKPCPALQRSWTGSLEASLGTSKQGRRAFDADLCIPPCSPPMPWPLSLPIPPQASPCPGGHCWRPPGHSRWSRPYNRTRPGFGTGQEADVDGTGSGLNSGQVVQVQRPQQYPFPTPASSRHQAPGPMHRGPRQWGQSGGASRSQAESHSCGSGRRDSQSHRASDRRAQNRGLGFSTAQMDDVISTLRGRTCVLK